MTSRSSVSPATLSKAVSHALRHEPWLYELELDDEGWAPLDQFLAAIHRQGGAWGSVGRNQIEAMIAGSDKQRHQLDGDRIRALYGHSVPGRLAREADAPPEVLLHGTSPEFVSQILQVGLKPMGRQYVHLSVDRETARAVGRRKHKEPVLLEVGARRAHSSSVAFYRGNDRVWLADAVPPEFIATTNAAGE